jgi:CRP-like cAMP-binding protein
MTCCLWEGDVTGHLDGCRRNRLLAALPECSFNQLRPHVHRVAVAPRHMLYRQGDPIRRVYFPLTGVFSVSRVLPDGNLIEVAPVGCEGLLGLEAFFAEHTVALGQVSLQVPEGEVAAVSVHVFRRELASHAALRAAVAEYAHQFLGTLMQSAACNALHTVEQRLARWLLAVQDRTHDEDLRLSGEAVAGVLGASRQSVSAAAGRLRRRGAIGGGPRRLTVCDRSILERAACACYFVLQQPGGRYEGPG